MLADFTAVLLGVLLLAGIALGIRLWRSWGGESARKGLIVDVLTQPPSMLSPAIVGALLNEKIAPQDIVALLIDLAQRGYLAVRQQRRAGVGPEFSLRRTGKDWADLADCERLLLRSLFEGAGEKQLSELNLDVTPVRRGLYQAAAQQGYLYASPERIRGRYMAFGLALACALFVLGFGVTALTFEWMGAAWCPFASLGLGVLALTVVGLGRSIKTQAGLSAAVHWRAFGFYLQHIERYTDVAAAPELFARYLPYAVAFGLPRRWMDKFAKAGATPALDWYSPQPADRAALLSLIEKLGRVSSL